MTRRIFLSLVAFITVMLLGTSAGAARLKELVNVQGMRENALFGYGLVVGLQGTGDDARQEITRRSLARLMTHLGVPLDPSDIKARNVAAVMVTAKLPPFARPGSNIDVVVSSIGNANSLVGGTLIATPLKGSDMRTYALAQGSLSLGAFSVAGDSGSSRSKNHTTVARIPTGGVIERAAPGAMPDKEVVLAMRRADFTTAARVAAAIDGVLGANVALVRDPGTVVVRVPGSWKAKVPTMIAMLEAVEVTPDAPAKVVIDERTGTIVVGAGVTLGASAIAHGGITVRIDEIKIPSQPPGGVFGNSNGETVVVPETQVDVQEEGGRLVVMQESPSVGDVAAALNQLGVKPRDLVAIFRALHVSGALRAEIEML